VALSTITNRKNEERIMRKGLNGFKLSMLCVNMCQHKHYFLAAIKHNEFQSRDSVVGISTG
jgi:hypothetical protein